MQKEVLNLNEQDFMFRDNLVAPKLASKIVGPTLSITKTSGAFLNKAFSDTLRKEVTQPVYYQLVRQGNVFFILLTRVPKPSFVQCYKGSMIAFRQEMGKMLGVKKGVVQRFSLEKIKTNIGRVKAFRLNPLPPEVPTLSTTAYSSKPKKKAGRPAGKRNRIASTVIHNQEYQQPASNTGQPSSNHFNGGAQ